MKTLKTQSLGELIDSTLALAFDYVRSTRKCPGLPDRDFVRRGISRVLTRHESGREWLQHVADVQAGQLPKSTFFEALHSQRRLEMLEEVGAGLARVASRQMSDAAVDWLGDFDELRGCEVFAADGHLIKHASHAERDAKGRPVPVGTIYALDLRTGLSRVVAHVSGDGKRRHEMPSLRESLRGHRAEAPVIWVLDRAYHDKAFWSKMWRERGVVMITRMKENMTPIRYASLPFDRHDPVNTGVTAHHALSLEGAWGTMFEVVYEDPETGEQFRFLTSAQFPRPGLAAWLYFLRWRIEKLYDTFKNRLGEKKAWATGDTAAQAQAVLIAMAYNLLRLLEARLGNECGLTDTKVVSKYHKQLDRRERQAQCRKRRIHPLLRKRRMPQLSAQFIRAVRNHLFDPKPLAVLLAAFAAALTAYL